MNAIKVKISVVQKITMSSFSYLKKKRQKKNYLPEYATNIYISPGKGEGLYKKN